MSNARHTPGPWKVGKRTKTVGVTIWRGDEPDNTNWARICRNVERPADAALIAAAPRMSVALQRAAHLLAELPQEQQTPQMLALRSEIVETIKQATPEYYGNTKGEQ